MRAVMAVMPKRWYDEHKASEAAQWDEVWNGELHMPPMPNGMHQDFAGDLRDFLKRHWAKPSGGLVRLDVNLTTPEDEDRWTHNYRIPDAVLVDRDRRPLIDRNTYMVGAPMVVVEIRSPGDDTYEKFPFYAGLGVPEVWVFDRDTKAAELYALGDGPAYQLLAAGPDGWTVGPASGVGFRPAGPGRVAVRVGETVADLPDA